MSEFNIPEHGDSLGAERTANDLTQNTAEYKDQEAIEEYFDRMLDPEGKLPKVTIEPDLEKKLISKNDRYYIIRNNDGVKIGSFMLQWLRHNKESTQHLHPIEIEKEYRGLGYGKSAYKEILKMIGADTLISDSQLSRGSKPIWDWLVESGVAVKTKDYGVLRESTQNASYSFDEYETLPLPNSVIYNKND